MKKAVKKASPSRHDIRPAFEQNFTGMTAEPIDLKELLRVRERLMSELQQGLLAPCPEIQAVFWMFIVR